MRFDLSIFFPRSLTRFSSSVEIETARQQAMAALKTAEERAHAQRLKIK